MTMLLYLCCLKIFSLQNPDPFLKCMTVEDPNARKSSLASLQAAAKKSGETSTLL